MNVKPGAEFEAVLDAGEPGLAGTITVEASDNAGGTAILPTALGIVEIAAGVYAAAGLTAPQDGGQYTLIWKDVDGDVLGIEDLVVTASAPADPTPPAPVYVSTDELFRVLHIRNPTAEQVTAAERVLVAAAGEVNSFIDRDGELATWETQLAAEVNLERAVEHWQQQESPFGLLGLGGDQIPIYTSRNSFYRHARKLMPLKGQFGLA